MTSPETPGTTPEHPTDTDAAVTAVIAGWNDEAHDERATASVGSTGVAASAYPRPTVRWGALVWSLLFGALAVTALWLMLEPDRREAAGDWLTTLSPLAAALYAVVALGVIVALFGIVGLIRRGEHAKR